MLVQCLADVIFSNDIYNVVLLGILPQVFNGKGGDRSTADNVLILFTDGKATDTNVSEEAQELKNAGVKIITVAMGGENFIDDYRDILQELASVDSETGQALQFEASFDSLSDLTTKLVKGAC